MVSGLPFLAALVCVAVVIFWYLRDESVNGGKGKSGLLGMRDEVERRRKAAHGPDWKPNRDAKPWRPERK
jgi:hypothetical protein